MVLKSEGNGDGDEDCNMRTGPDANEDVRQADHLEERCGCGCGCGDGGCYAVLLLCFYAVGNRADQVPQYPYRHRGSFNARNEDNNQKETRKLAIDS